MSDRLEKAPVIEPVDPFERGELDGFEAAPWSPPVDDLGLVETVDGFRERVVVAVADTADRRLDPGLGQALGIFDRDILAAADALLFVKWRSAPD